jgi:hypothetical protein
METLNPNPRRAQSERRNPEPFVIFAQAVDRGEIRLSLDGDSVAGEIADEDTWREILEAAGAHPRHVEGVVLVADDGEIVRLHRLVER